VSSLHLRLPVQLRSPFPSSSGSRPMLTAMRGKLAAPRYATAVSELLACFLGATLSLDLIRGCHPLAAGISLSKHRIITGLQQLAGRKMQPPARSLYPVSERGMLIGANALGRVAMSKALSYRQATIFPLF
jgi:hypothetical protein